MPITASEISTTASIGEAVLAGVAGLFPGGGTIVVAAETLGPKVLQIFSNAITGFATAQPTATLGDLDVLLQDAVQKATILAYTGGQTDAQLQSELPG